ncbi:MAG: 16S rRNA (guanine(527)-N(7))-methyltransferase RsmG [Clostridia bacterium]|nr:16S rRNA (guanine(527)-N(7))-methyltransferase RsmG [Clostridia bacterium]
MKNKLTLALDKEGFTLSDTQIDKFVIFSRLLKEWNKKMNLTAIEGDEEIIYKHFLDSLLCLKTGYFRPGQKVIDVGTGAGFPGIPLKILLDDQIELTLFDSLQKRINFLQLVVDELELANVHCVHGRAEDFGKITHYREQFDLVLARAVARLPILLELCLPFCKVGGFFLAMKGPEGSKELEESNYALQQLGGNLKKVDKFFLNDNKYERLIINVEKTGKTPDKFPRKAGIPQKRPLISLEK